jgi:membrane-bound metal-dependent hydrolase YbcI (DUF457 family)
MPSPIAHLAAGYTIYYLSRSRQPQMKAETVGPLPAPLLVAAGFSLLPDVDSLAGLVMGNFGRFHNNVTHSYVVGFLVSLLFAALMYLRQRQGFVYWFFLALLSYDSHVLMDSATISRGVMAIWPFRMERYLLPFRLFYGFHWSDGLLSVRHIWTFLSEGIFAAVLVVLARLLQPQKWLSLTSSR